jgi:hypothetical protein
MKSILLVTVLIFHFSLFIFHSLFAQQNDIPVNPNSTWNGEISLAVNPTNPANLVAAWMKATGLFTVSIAISSSNDHGLTWSDPVYMPHFSSSYTSADPTLTVSSSGTFHFAYIDYNNITFAAGAVYVTRSTDSGITWAAPSPAIDATAAPDVPIDRPWLAIDNSTGPDHGKLYLVTKSIKEATVTHHIWLVRSTDDGLTWDTPKILDDPLPVGATANTMGVPCVSSSGAMYVNYLSFDISQSLHARDVYIRSDDGGATFTNGIISELPFNSVIPPEDSLYQYSYHIAANPSDSNNLVHIITDRRDGDWDIWYNVSQDGGNTWTPTTRLNDDPIGNGIGQDMCWGGFSTGGVYAALWRDRRDGVTGQTSSYRIYGSCSNDKGNTFSANFAFGKTLAPLFIPISGNDFLGVCLSDSTVYGTWSDSRTGQNQEYFNSRKITASSGNGELKNDNNAQIIPGVIFSSFTEINPAYIQKNKPYQVQIYDLPGRCILQQKNKSRIDLGDLPAGMYILELTTSGTRVYQRFIRE